MAPENRALGHHEKKRAARQPGSSLTEVGPAADRLLFNSLDFLLFFPVVVAAYLLVPRPWRWAVALATSYAFYGWWRVEYLGLIVVSTLVDYSTALAIARHSSLRWRRMYVGVSVGLNLTILAVFKYTGLFAEVGNAVVAAATGEAPFRPLDVLLPVGISFYTFQTMAYTIDVYRGRIEPERHLGLFALYVSFWPQLVAGPIERARSLLPQLTLARRPTFEEVAYGLQLMTWGFFLKVVVADRSALFAEALFREPAPHHGVAVLGGLYAGTLQLYCDFAGYSLIAIGAASTLGVRLSTNFRQPYLAATMGDLWTRWHITLTTWFRDYLYAPLRRGRLRLGPSAAIAVVFALTGLWHGAALTFVLWGALHGLYLVAERATLPLRDRLWSTLPAAATSDPAPHRAGLAPVPEALRHVAGILWTYHVWVLFGILFYASSVGEASAVFRNLFAPGDGSTLMAASGQSTFDVVVWAGAIGLVFAVDLLERRQRLTEWIARRPAVVRWTLWSGLILATLMFGEFDRRDFFYFQF